MAAATLPKHKYFADQFDDEEVLFVFHKHPIVMRWGIVWSSVGILLPMFYILARVYTSQPGSPGFPTMGTFYLALLSGIVLGGLIFFPYWIGWYFSVFIMTDQRFIQITQKGLFHRAVADLALAQIQSVNYEVAGLQETLLGFGTIKMQTYVGDLTIHDVHKPAHIQKKIVGILRDQGLTGNPYSSGNQPPQKNEETKDTEAE